MEHTLDANTLAQFTGTEHYYRHNLLRSIRYTDGVKYVAETGGAYWLIDIIASVQLDPKVRNEEFQVWKLTVNDNRGFVTCEDGNGHEVYRQMITWTDFPLPEIKFYLTNNVILLPSEY